MNPADPFTNIEIVTIAVGQLDGFDRPVHLEDVAVKAFELSPGAFRWDLDAHADRIDKDKVRVSLTDAEKPSRGFVAAVGSTKSGVSKRTDYWRVTTEGVDWLEHNGSRIEEFSGSPRRAIKKSAAQSLQRRVERSELYGVFLSEMEVPDEPYLFADLIECSPDAPPRVFREKFDRLRVQIALTADEQLKAFIDSCEATFARILRESGDPR